MAHGIPARLSRAEERKFGLALGGAFALLTLVLWWRGRVMPMYVSAGIAAVLLGMAIVAPLALAPVRRAWMGFALRLSKITTPIFMSIVYFLVILPIGLVRRALGNNPVVHAERDASFWAVREPARRRSNLTRQF